MTQQAPGGLRTAPKLVEMFRNTNWSETVLGSMNQWPQSLRTVVGLMLDSQFPMFLAWGPKRIFLYNDAYVPILGKKHPEALGKEFEFLWSEIWNDLLPLVESVDKGKAVYQEDLRLIMHRNGFDEEVFFTFSYSPIRDESDNVAGLFCACVETTERVKAQIAAQKSLEETAKSEQELVDILESMSDAFFSLDKDWRFTRINRHHEKLVKKSREEQIGRSLIDVWFNDPKYEESLYLKAYRKAMTERVTESFVDYYDPLKFWTEVRVYPKSDGGIAVFFTDITKRKQIEAEVKENNEQLKLAIDAAKLGTFYWNFVTGEMKWSDLTYKMFGFDPNRPTMTYGSFLKALHVTDRQRIEQTIKAAVTSGEEFQAEFRTQGEDQIERWILAHARIIGGSREQQTYMLGTVQDITERKRAHIEYERSVDVSPAILWITDKDGSCNYLSKQWFEVTGQTHEQALGFGWLDATHPDDKEHTAEVYLSANRQQKHFYAEYRLRNKSGDYRWAIDAGNPRYDINGNFLGYAGAVFDIHEQKVAAAEIEELNYRFKRSAQASDLGVWYCDLPFDVLIWNDEVKRHFFLPLDSQVTIDIFYERIHPDDRESTRKAIQQSIETRTPYNTVYRTTNPLNPTEVKSIRAIGWTDYNSTGQPMRFDGITLDVSLELHRRAELEAAKNEAERANQLKSSFLANMSHEIRTPLGAILGFTDILKDKTITNEERTHFLDTISRNGKALTKIIDDILDLAKVESGKLEVEKTEFSFFDLIDDVMDLFREHTRAKGIYLRANLENDAPNRIISDPTRLRQILINIVGNAVKFTNKGGISIGVVGLNKGDALLEFKVTVKDTGVGMDLEQRERIFQPFIQADNSMTRKFGGTGLGLALSKRLANALSGDISLQDSTLNRGCTFVISFLATLPHAVQNQSPKISTMVEVEGILSGVRVLVADDSKDNLLLVSRMLRKQGAEVETADNGLEAFRKGIGGSYDIILMDIQMPEMDGYEATRSLREAGFKKPIIALTAHAMTEERARSLAAGCDGHLTKPLDQIELLNMVQLNVANNTRSRPMQ